MGLGVVVVLIAVTAIAVTVYRAQQPDVIAVPRNATSAGVPVGKADAPVTVDLYFDYLCPFCKRFEQDAAPVIAKAVADGTVRAVYHPISILDGASSTRYSTRAASAGGCVAAVGPEQFTAFTRKVFEDQPPENSAGLTDAQLTRIAADSGAPNVRGCVTARAHAGWVADLTERASKAGVTSTPTVLVNGAVVEQPDAAKLSAAIERAKAR